MNAKKTKKEFLNEYATNKELATKTLNQGGVQWSSILEYPKDYYAANTGAIPGMIYYNDTVKFAKKNHLLILQAIDEFEEENGRLENKPSTKEETQYFNWLAWFAWENTMGEVLNYLEE